MPEARHVQFGGKDHEFPADATDAEISAALGAIPATNAPRAPKAKTWTDVAISALPVLGGIIGGTVGAVGGPPGMAAGAALGAAGGEGYRQLANRAAGNEAPSTMTEAATNIATEGALAGATTGALGVAGKGVAAAAQAISPKALKIAGLALFSPKLALKKAVMSVIEDVAQDIAATAKPAEKLAISARDYANIAKLKSAGVPEGDAVRAVVNMRAKALTALKQ